MAQRFPTRAGTSPIWRKPSNKNVAGFKSFRGLAGRETWAYNASSLETCVVVILWQSGDCQHERSQVSLCRKDCVTFK